MKYLWIMCSGAIFVCHAMDIQKTSKDVEFVAQLLSNLYRKKEIAIDSQGATQLDTHPSKRILLKLEDGTIPFCMRTFQGTFELPKPKSAHIDLKEFFEELRNEYEVTLVQAKGAHDCESPPRFVMYELQRKTGEDNE